MRYVALNARTPESLMPEYAMTHRLGINNVLKQVTFGFYVNKSIRHLHNTRPVEALQSYLDAFHREVLHGIWSLSGGCSGVQIQSIPRYLLSGQRIGQIYSGSLDSYRTAVSEHHNIGARPSDVDRIKG
jgi:hypothetical protein